MSIRLLIFSLFFFTLSSLFSQFGTINGTVSDAETGETLVGVNVIIKDPFMGSNTDINGYYELDHVPAGIYTVSYSYVSYAPLEVKEVTVKAGEKTTINVKLRPESMGLEEVVVKARRIDHTENAILSMQKRALSVQDGISSQEMEKSGVGNAAQSVAKITGVSIVDGKHINVRGLGDRYSGAQLNGVTLASTDPYSNSASLDLIPANMLEKVIASKTFSPDMPGNFTGGNVNLSTKSFPEHRFFKVSLKTGYNTQSSFNSSSLSFDAGRYAFAGYNDGTLQLPAILEDPSTRAELGSDIYIKARRDDRYAGLLDESIKSMHSEMAPTAKPSGNNYSFNLSYGKQFKILGRPLGIMAGAGFSRNLSHYANGSQAAWDITGLEADRLFAFYELHDTKSVQNPSVNAITTLSYKLSDNHELGANFIYNHDAKYTARYQQGAAPGFISASNALFETRTLHYQERGLGNFQFRGKHLFPSLGELKVEWIGGLTNSFQNDPDLRFFANEIRDSQYYIRVSEYSLPSHFFRTLKDQGREFKMDFELPISSGSEFNKLKFGFLANEKTRKFRELRFDVNNDKGERYAGDPEAYFGPANSGIIGYDELRHRNVIGLYLVNNSRASNSYNGLQRIYAAYGMMNYRFGRKLKASGGVRMEHTQISVQSADSTLEAGQIRQSDFLPALNLIYTLNENMNIRASASKTIARPSMRELAPFSSFDYIGGFIYIGNPELKQSLVNNFDLRWEWFTRPGEVFAVSAFYKKFKDPISKFYNSEAYNPEIIFQNTKTAYVYGAELDLRKRLDVISPVLKNFKTGVNFTYIASRVAMDPAEYQILSSINPELKSYRPFQGQSPYLVNAFLSYDSDTAGIHAMISYNVFGPRLSEIGKEGVPDIYEQPRHMLNFRVSKKMGRNLEWSVEMQNLLNTRFEKSQNFKGEKYITEGYQLGRTFNIGMSWMLK